MKISPQVFLRAPLLATFALLIACGGGGGSTTQSATDNPSTSVDPTQGSRIMSFSDDIEPILQGKCLGCHNDEPNAIAPFSLDGADQASGFKSAIHFTLESGTMPPAGSKQLSKSEIRKLTAWLTDQPYTPSTEKVRISLVQAPAWDTGSRNRDAFLTHRPDQVDCERDTGWLVEEDALEVRTESCNYLFLTQQTLLNLDAGTTLELALSHSDLDFNAPASAHVAIAIAGTPVWETEIAIPSEGNIIKQTLELPFAVSSGDPIDVHLHNHGSNAWTIHSIDALVSDELDLEFCASFDSTWEAIESVVIEQAGCANSLCHGDAAAGGLDLSPGVAYENLVGVSATASSLRLVSPREPAESFLYHKLSAKTFPGSYDISGSPMPSAGSAISAGALEALRLWIEAGAPETGSVGDTIGRGEDELERLLGVCLPEAEAVNTVPLDAPEREVGVQFEMPPHDVQAESEKELCFAVYEDFRDIIPAQYMSADREFFYASGDEVREDAFTHHNILMYAGVPIEDIHDPSLGEWTCIGGEQSGSVCEPTDVQSCGVGKCRSEAKPSVACIGYGPGNGPIAGLGANVGSYLTQDGYFETFPTHGVFYWNSHAFNLTTDDANHHVWRNLFYTDDRRFDAEYFTYSNEISAGKGTPPFERKTVCRDYVLAKGDGLIYMSSHTHKRGEHFTVALKGGEQIYETYTYDEPLNKLFEPHLVFNSDDPAERTLEFCATYNNGLNADGSFNLDKVTRASRRPDNGRSCEPVACVAGNVGAACSGVDDNASCDSTSGAGDGWCDACEITSGISSDDEMFVLLGATLDNYDERVNQPAPAEAAEGDSN
jgi:mono/diheme cytochrome c family protein